MIGYVGYQQVDKARLEQLIQDPKLAIAPSYYFLRWFHKVSGIQMKLPDDFPSPEGQLFNAELELRWKQRGATYEVLLLSKAEPDAKLDFSPLRGDWEWEWCDRNAYCYDSDETKFPKGFLYQDAEGNVLSPKEEPLNQVKQRYFRDARTTTVHFVALTVENIND
ncbi:MAG: hypothetical protein NW224_08035 [Leptolyngbyaceae cyanobacterium bins.302]|nr:hypothetical protein [Leptolyngbyaceae cyanobacterium bins.302]